MDLIFCNNNFVDVGVLQNYTLDMAIGADENDFELKMPSDYTKGRTTRGLAMGDFIYFADTEYGGMVDAMTVGTAEKELSFTGRTWTGLLKTKVIEPPPGQTHRVYTGEANAVLTQMLSDANLGDMFVASTDDSEITISEFQVRYNDVYESIIDMLSEVGAKLKMRYSASVRRCVVYAEQAVNYSALEYLDSEIVQMNVGRVRNRCNHLICLGKGEGVNRHVIHLFTDGNGGPRPYLYDMSKQPEEDADYILDKSQQVLFGKDEYTEVYDYSSVEAEESYKRLISEPADWEDNYPDYYEKSGGDYVEITPVENPIYELLDERPDGWKANFSDYYTRSRDPVTGEYTYTKYSGSIQSKSYTEIFYRPADWETAYANYYIDDGQGGKTRVESNDKYILLDSKPSNWKKHHGDYFTFDGVNYNSVSSASRDKYIVQTARPSDWNANWENSYMQENGKYKQIKDTTYYTQKKKTLAIYGPPTWKKNTYYNRGSESIPPNFDSLGAVYEKQSKPPAFNSLDHVYMAEVKMNPAWAENTYYALRRTEQIPIRFSDGVYYQKVYDNYFQLVEGGLERLTELNEVDKIDVEMSETEQQFDIGDIVGAMEEITETPVAQMITKKIITINERNVLSVRYEV